MQLSTHMVIVSIRVRVLESSTQFIYIFANKAQSLLLIYIESTYSENVMFYL